MAGLGLSAAVDSFMQGREWARGQREYERVQKQRADIEAANQAAMGVIEQSKAEWAANGAQGMYRPNDSTMFKAAEARGMALARAGLWDQFLANDAQVVPMRIKARASALHQYEQDGDIEKLAKTVYPTMFDGKEIVGTEKLEGAEGSVRLGLSPIASKIRLKLSDGSVKTLEPQQLVTTIKASLVDPVEAAKNEVRLNFERTKQQLELDAKLREIAAKGVEERTTEDVKAGHARNLEGIKFGNQRSIHAEDAVAAQRRTETTASATRYAADKRAEAAREGKEGSGGNKRDARYGQIHTEITKVYGQGTTGLAGEGKSATQDTQAMAAYADALMDSDPSLSMAQAISKSVEEWKKRNPEFKPPRSRGGLGLGG